MKTGSTRAGRTRIAAASVWLAAACSGQASDVFTFTDAGGDAWARRGDFGNDAPGHPDAVLPDLLSVSVYGWEPDDAAADPYTGHVGHPRASHLFRLDLVLNGLVNPPGTIGTAGEAFDPFRYGPSPVFGFIEIDMDDDRSTGGELGASATQRYLANVGRFGARPHGSIGERTARSGFEQDYDASFYSEPQFERSGAEFELSLCGCFGSAKVCESGDGDGVFEAGETWIVRGRFFQRAGGYREASVVHGGSEPQAYDPWVNVRFQHDTETDRTTVTLVYALDMIGAGLLLGEPTQLIDDRIDLDGSHSSVEEAIQDVIDGANGDHGDPLSGPVWVLARRWEDRERKEALEIDDWRVSGLVGTGCSDPSECSYIWTDVGFNEHVGDLNSDGVVNELDVGLFDTTLQELDGGPFDADGQPDGSVHIPNFAANFNLLDFTYDGVIDATDRRGLVPACDGDFNMDGYVNSQDFFDFLAALFELSPAADINHDQMVNSQDYFDFLVKFFSGC